MGDFDSSSSSSSSDRSSDNKQVQFGRTPMSEESISEVQSQRLEVDEQSFNFHFEVDDVNARLRHQMPTAEPRFETQHLSRVMAAVSTIVVQTCRQQISILREMNKMSHTEVSLEYVPLSDKYNSQEYDMDFVCNPSEEFLMFKKFKRDFSWIESILKVLISDLQRNFNYEDLPKILKDDDMIRQEEETLLGAKEFNRRELQKLKSYIDSEKKELTRELQDVTEALGNAKDELNDSIMETKVKKEYITHWENSRHEQNTRVLQKREEILDVTAKQMNIEIDKENRVHEEMWLYLENSLQEFKADIVKWMDKYDEDLETQERDVADVTIKLENQRDNYQQLLEEYNERQKAIDDYKQHKLELQREAEELERRTHAAVRIQSWWRGVMFRKGLGPWRRKKGKGKKGGSGKNSAKKTKK